MNEIQSKIYFIRSQKVMMDSDLAELYGVETKVLVQAVKRNNDRFPDDFMFLCDFRELAVMKSQFVTSYDVTHWNNKRKNLPLLFTEQGIAMLSSVLNSKQAIQVNIMIIRIFVKMRNSLVLEEPLAKKVSEIEASTNKLFKIVFERINTIDDQIAPKLSPTRKKIGLKS